MQNQDPLLHWLKSPKCQGKVVHKPWVCPLGPAEASVSPTPLKAGERALPSIYGPGTLNRLLLRSSNTWMKVFPFA